jgi:hypothetical protein
MQFKKDEAKEGRNPKAEGAEHLPVTEGCE